MITFQTNDGEEITYKMKEAENTAMNEDGLDDVYARYSCQLRVQEAFELFDGNTIYLDIPPQRMQVKECTVSASGFLEGEWIGYFNAADKYYKVKHVLGNWEYITLYEWDTESDVDNTDKGNAYCHDRDRKGNMTEAYRYKYVGDGKHEHEVIYSVYEHI